VLTVQGVRTCIVIRPGPALPQRHDPTAADLHTLTCTPKWEEPANHGLRLTELAQKVIEGSVDLTSTTRVAPPAL
jgi:hypothetical protein